MFPCAEQGYRVGAIAITRIERPSHTLRAYGILAIVELVAVIVKRDQPSFDGHLKVARVHLVTWTTPRS